MAYGFYRTLTIDKTKVPNTNRTDFPVLVSGTYSWLATVANGGKVQHASGYDVAFYSDAALTTQLKHEVERWIATTGEVVYWVKVPTVSTSADTVIYIAYGDSGISTDQSDAVNVWDTNFKGVWHLPNGTTLTALDSTSNANNGTITGDTVAIAGKVGGAADFDGTGDYINVGSGASLDDLGPLTFSAWINPDSLVGDEFTVIGKGDGSTAVRQLDVGDWFGRSDVLAFYVRRATTAAESYSANGTITTAAWQYVVGTWDGTNAPKLYKNGAEVTYGAQVAGSGAVASDAAFNAGVGARHGGGNVFNGKIDEARVSNVVRSADWIAT